jgi:RNase P/RNase MRP subunit POP5
MVVRDKVGRKRYVVLIVNTESTLSHEDFEQAVVSLLREKGVLRSVRPKLIDFDGQAGIIRCAHTGRDEMIDTLASITVVSGAEVQVETVKTSGTLRKAREVAKGLASR